METEKIPFRIKLIIQCLLAICAMLAETADVKKIIEDLRTKVYIS